MSSLLADFGMKVLPSRSVNRVDLLQGYTKAPYLKGTPRALPLFAELSKYILGFSRQIAVMG